MGWKKKQEEKEREKRRASKKKPMSREAKIKRLKHINMAMYNDDNHIDWENDPYDYQ